jgi:hypothetical protein
MRVAIVATPGHGHVNPLLPIAAELARGGDRVASSPRPSSPPRSAPPGPSRCPWATSRCPRG